MGSPQPRALNFASRRSKTRLGVSQNLGSIFGGPENRMIAVWGLYWCPPVYGNYHPHNGANENRNESERGSAQRGCVQTVIVAWHGFF